MNDRVFPNTTFRSIRDIPVGYQLSKRIVSLGPMKLPGMPDFYPEVTTTAGEELNSKVANIVCEEIKPSSGPGITFDPNAMWHSSSLVDGKALIYLKFPVPVQLTGISIHSEQSGLDHAVRRMQLETNDPSSRQLVVESRLKSIDKTVTFPAASATRWTLTLTAGPSRIRVIRGLRFFDGQEEVCPHTVPYQDPPAITQAAGSE